MTRVELLTLGFVVEVKKLARDNHNDMDLGKKVREALAEHEEKVKKAREEEKTK